MSRLSKLIGEGHYYFPTDGGQFVSQEQVRTAEILRDYDPNLQLQWIPPNDRGPDDDAFRVVWAGPGRPPYVVLTAPEANPALLARVWAADQQSANGGRGNLLSWIDHYNAAVEISNAKKMEEERAADLELAHAIISSNKYHYKTRDRNGNLYDWGKVGGGRFD